MGCVYHATEEQFEQLLTSIRKNDQWRADQMPDEASAIRVLNEAYKRLQELGWREAIYAPRDKPLDLIELGSTGVHSGQRGMGEDDDSFWVFDAGDVWPSRAVLWRNTPASEDEKVR